MREPVSDYQSVEKAFRLLEQLGGGHSRGVTELADAVGLDKGAVSRMLKTLTALGYTERQGPRGRFGIGPKILVLGRGYLDTADLRSDAKPALQELALAARATAVLAVASGNQILIVLKSFSPEKVQVATTIGDVLPAHASASGRVLLCESPASERDKFMDYPLKRFTPRTVTDKAALTALLKDVARDGYAVERGEEDAAVACIAAPVRDDRGLIVAAIAATGPIVGTPFVPDESHVRMVKEAAATVSTRLGYVAGRTLPHSGDHPNRVTSGEHKPLHLQLT
jgi:IclR family acetate operon transcriptional repressor